MSRNATLWFAPVLGLLGCQAPDAELIDIEFGADESADEDTALVDATTPAELSPYPDSLLVAPLAGWKYSPQTTGIPLGATILAAHLDTDVDNAPPERFYALPPKVVQSTLSPATPPAIFVDTNNDFELVVTDEP